MGRLLLPLRHRESIALTDTSIGSDVTIQFRCRTEFPGDAAISFHAPDHVRIERPTLAPRSEGAPCSQDQRPDQAHPKPTGRWFWMPRPDVSTKPLVEKIARRGKPDGDRRTSKD